MTPLDTAHAAMEGAPEDDAARLRFFERLAEGEVFLMLKAEPEGDRLDPEVFQTGDGAFVLVFDREERLAAFAGRPAPYAGLPGRTVVAMLAGQGVGMALNPEVAPSSMLLDPAALAWLHDALGRVPDEMEARPEEITAPHGLPEALLGALDGKLARAAGLARCAYLVGVRYPGGSQGHLLGFVDPAPGAEATLARATGEALTFSGIEAGVLDVAFFTASDPLSARLARVGLRFDLPPVDRAEPSAPGTDPDRPPRLR